MSGSTQLPTKQMEAVQRLATIAITGTLRTTATDVLNLHTHTLPINLLLDKRCHWAIVRMATLEKIHPTHKLTRRCTRQYICQHRSSLHKLCDTYNFKLDTIKIQQDQEQWYQCQHSHNRHKKRGARGERQFLGTWNPAAEATWNWNSAVSCRLKEAEVCWGHCTETWRALEPNLRTES